MKRSLKIFLLAFTAIAAIGAFFWMLSLASWRPAKIRQAESDDILAFVSSDGKTALTRNEEGGGYGSIIQLESGKRIKWPDANPIDGLTQDSPELALTLHDYDDKQQELDVREVSSGRLWLKVHWPLTKSTPDVVENCAPNTVAVADGAFLLSWKLENGQLLQKVHLQNSFPPPAEQWSCYALQGNQLIGCCGKQGKIWDAHTGQLLRMWNTNAYEYPASFSPDGRAVFYTSLSTTPTNSYAIVDAKTGRVRWQLQSDGALYCYCSQHEMVLPQKENCRVVDLLTGKTKRELPGPREKDGSVLRVTPDYIYTYNAKNEISRWRAR